MTLSEYSALLSQFLKDNPQYANHVAAYAVDDEGNEYQEIDIDTLSVGWIEPGYRSETFLTQDDLDDDPSWDVSAMVPAVVVN